MENSAEYIDIVFDGLPDAEGPRFIEIEDQNGASIQIGEWVKRPDGYHALRIPRTPESLAVSPITYKQERDIYRKSMMRLTAEITLLKRGKPPKAEADLRDTVDRLAKAAARVGNLDHAGIPIPPEDWAELYNSHCAMMGALAGISKKVGR